MTAGTLVLLCLISAVVGTGIFWRAVRMISGGRMSGRVLLIFFALSFLLQYAVLTALGSNQVI